MKTQHRRLPDFLHAWRRLAVIALLVLAGVLAWWACTSGSPGSITAKDPATVVVPPEDEIVVFRGMLDWTDQYLSASVPERADLLADGVALARERRAALAELIQTDPEAALAAAVPRSLRAQLPEAIHAELEELISARAPLNLVQKCFDPEGCTNNHKHDLYRSAVIDEREYRVHVYGSRLNDLSIPETSIHGIAIDGHLAVSESRARVLEPGEALPPGVPTLANGAIAVEVGGEVTVLPDATALADFEQVLVDEEKNPTVIAADSGQGAINVTSRPSEAWATGAKKLLVIMVDFDDLPGRPLNKSASNSPITEDDVDSLINGTDGVRKFYQDGSFGKTDLLLTPPVAGDSPDVTEVLRMPQSASYYANTGGSSVLGSHADAAAAAAGYDLNAYDRICRVYTNLANFAGGTEFNGWGGRASVGGKGLSINGYWEFRVVAHELGHNWGLKHANLWQVTDGNPASLSGSSTAYGDSYDTMGAAAGDSAKHFSQWNKSLLWWIPDSAVPVATADGTYRVHRLDHGGANLDLARALKIVRDDTRDYWIGYRRATPTSVLNNGAYVLWGYNRGYDEGDLLDLNTPGTSISDAPLPLHQTFNDSAAGISFTPVAQGGSGADEWLDIQVDLQPRISWSSPEYTVDEAGAMAVMTVNRSVESSGAVFVNYASAPGTATAPTDFTATSGALYWADGDMAPKTISIPIVADALTEGEETFTVTLSSPTGGVVFDPDTSVDPHVTTVTIAEPGYRDRGFAAAYMNNTVYSTLALPDGKILVGGAFQTVQDSAGKTCPYQRIARMHADGSLDTGFQPSAGANSTVYALARQADGKILVGGSFTTFNGVYRYGIARLEADGSLDTSFNPGSGASGNTVYAILPLPDGKILVGGNFYSFGGTAREYLARLHPDGSLDSGFVGPDFAGTSGSSVESLAVQTDGKILAGGSFYFSGTPSKTGICRMLTNGSLDPAFNGVAEGAQKAVGDFSTGRIVRCLAVQPDGKILMAGTFSAFNNIDHSGVARLTSSGSLDAGFAPQTDNYCAALCLLPDQSILIGGYFTSVSGTPAARIARLSSTGVVDGNFAGDTGTANWWVRDLALQADGNVVLGGDYRPFQGASQSRPVWRFVSGLAGSLGVHEFAVDAVAGLEGRSVTLEVTRSGGSRGNLSVAYSTVPGSGTATAGVDYTTTAGTLTWLDGDSSSKTITIPLLADGTVEPSESFLVNLGEPLIGGSLLAQRQQMTITIRDSGSNAPPSFISDPIAGDDATEASAYTATLANSATDLNNDELSFAKVSGPAWLSVAANGGLSGTPGLADVGANGFVVSVSDNVAAPVEATLNITVVASTATVPDGVGLAQATAESHIVAVGFAVGSVATVYNETVAAGNVISQSPAAGVRATLGDGVDLVVSLGAPPNNPPVVDAGVDQSVTLNSMISWSPAEIGLAAWYDASDATTITASGGLVSQWRDKSGKGRHVSQGTTGKQPTTGVQSLNDLNVLACDGGDYLQASAFPVPASGDIAIFMVARVDTIDNEFDSLFSMDASKDFQFDAGSGSQFNGRYWVSNIGSSVSASGGPFGGPGIYNCNFDMSVSGAYNAYVDGVKRIADTNYTSKLDTTQVFGIFVNRGKNQFPAGVVAEVVVTSDLSADSRHKMEGYLAHKWGRAEALPAGHPYESSAPSQTSAMVILNGAVSDEDGGIPATVWSLVNGPAAVSFSDASALDATVTFAATGTYVLRLTADDGTDTVMDEVTITVKTPYDSWVVGSFSQPFVVAGMTENPDGDDYNNLQEFAFGMDPTHPGTPGLVFVANGDVTQAGAPILMNFAAQGQAPDYRAAFARRKDHAAAGLVYTVQFSADLAQWTTSFITPTLLTGTDSSGDMEAVGVPYMETVPANSGTENLPPRFFRVGVAAP